MGSRWGTLLNFWDLHRLIIAAGFRERTGMLGRGWDEIPVSAAWASLIFVCLFALLILNTRLRARETVRG
jgi:hypothetical protein